MIEVINFEDLFYLRQQASQQAEVPARDAEFLGQLTSILGSLMPSGAETTNRRLAKTAIRSWKELFVE